MPTIFGLISMGTISSLIITSYSLVYLKVAKIAREFSNATGNNEKNALEQRIFYRCVYILVGFFGCYTLNASILLIQLITQTPLGPVIDLISVLIVACDTFISPFIVYYTFILDVKNKRYL